MTFYIVLAGLMVVGLGASIAGAFVAEAWIAWRKRRRIARVLKNASPVSYPQRVR